MSRRPCPLCRGSATTPLVHAHGRAYRTCATCGLVFVAPEYRLDPAAERAHYDTHENDPADPGYRAFLNRLAEPLAACLSPGAEGLDYGAGPGPTLSIMLQERGFRMALYDPFFAPDEAPLRRTYDFITCTEAAEHFFEPGAELARLAGLLRPGGHLGIMTEVLRPERDLAAWRYARDPTHVAFYRPETMRWIAQHYGWTLTTPHPNVAIFTAPGR